MKPTLRFLSLVLTLLLVVNVLVAGQITRAQDPAATEEAPTPTITPTPLPSVEGTLTIWVNSDRAAIIEAAGKEFTAKYNIPVRIQTMNFGDVRNNFNIAAPAGSGPDIIVGAHDWIGGLFSNGLLSEIDLGDKAKSFDPVALKAFTYDGKLVGVPYQVEAVAMYYNKDLVPTPPKTFEELMPLAKQLVDDKKVDQAFAFTVSGEIYGHYAILTSFGGGVFARDDEGNYDGSKVILDSEGSIKGASELDTLVKSGVLKDAVTYDVARDLFVKGKLAMWVNGPWELDNIRKAGINYGIAVIPAGTEAARPFVGVQGFMVSKLSKNELLAQAFVTEFLASDDIMMQLYEAQFGIPAWLPTREEVMNPDIEGFSASVADGDPMPAIPEMASVWNIGNSAIALIYQQKEDAEQAMKDAGEALRDAIAKGTK